MKHLREENLSKTTIIKILSGSKNDHVNHSCNTSNSSIQQSDFTKTPKYPNNARFRTPTKPEKLNK